MIILSTQSYYAEYGDNNIKIATVGKKNSNLQVVTRYYITYCAV